MGKINKHPSLASGSLQPNGKDRKIKCHANKNRSTRVTRNVKNEMNFWVQMADWTHTFSLSWNPSNMTVKGFLCKGKNPQGWGTERGTTAATHRRLESRGMHIDISDDWENWVSPAAEEARKHPAFHQRHLKNSGARGIHIDLKMEKQEGVTNKKHWSKVCLRCS